MRHMRALALSPFVARDAVVAAGETVELTEREFNSVRGHVAPVESPKPVKPLKPIAEKKVIEKKAPKSIVEKKTLQKKK